VGVVKRDVMMMVISWKRCKFVDNIENVAVSMSPFIILLVVLVQLLTIR